MMSPSTPPNKPPSLPSGGRSTKATHTGSIKNPAAHLRQVSQRPAESTFSRREKDESFAARRKLVQLEADLNRVQAVKAIDKAELENKIRLLQEELDDAQQQLREPLFSKEYQHLRSQFEAQFRKLILENKESGEKVAELQGLVIKGRAAELKNGELARVNAALEEQLKELQESSRQKKLLLEQEAKDIQARCNELQNHNSTLVSDMEELRETFVRLENDLSTEKNKVIARELDKHQLQEELKDCNERNKKLVAQVHRIIKDQMLKASHKAPQSEFVVNSIAGPRSRSQNTEELPSGYESDNVTIRDGPQKVEEESSTSTVDNNDSNDSFEAEIDRILPERKDYIRSVDQSTTGASCLESEAQWDIDHEKDIVPISVAAAGQPVANDDTDPFSSGQLTSGAEQCTAVESTVVKNEKDPWMEQKLKEIFGAIEIQYSAEETSRYIVTPPSEVTPIQQTDFVRSRQDETPTKKGNIHSESSMLGETSGDIPRHSSPRKSQDTPSVATPVQDEEDYNKAAPVKLTVGGDAAEHLEAIGKMESISASSSVSHCNPIMPWVENALPEKFELIRELVFSRVPKDVVRLDGVFKQLTTGLVEKVLLNRKARVLRIIYVEPIAAREQYIKFYNRGLYIPKGSAPPQSSASSASSAASGKKALEQYHVLMPDLFQYSVNSKPLSSQLRDAIYKGNLTRVCRMRGAVQGLSVKKLEEDLFKLVPNLPKNVHDVFDSIHINEEAGEILVRFTAMVYSARTFNFLKTSKGYYGFIPGYGPDPCNYKPLAEIRQKHEQTPKSTAMVQHKEPNKEEPSQKIPEDNKPIQPAPVKIHIEAYKNPAARGADNMDPAQINYMLRQFAERGLISNRVLRARGLLPPAGAKWDKGDDTDVKREDGNWAALEQNAVRAYRASLKEKNDISARAGPTIPDPDTVYAREDYSTRLVCVTGLPSYISYDLFCPYVKGGAVDTVRLNPDEGTAVIIFLRAKDATNYRDYIIANEIYIDNHRMINQNPSLTRLHNMRLWDPVKVLREGLSRCVFVEGIPNGTTPSILKADIASMNPTVRIEYESIVINGVCARVCCPSISMANFIHRNLGSQPKYTGVRVRYEEDFCSGHLSFIGQAFTP